MVRYFLLLVILVAVGAETNTGCCKDMLQGYLTGQMSSALGACQVETLRQELKNLSDVIGKLHGKGKNCMNNKDSIKNSVIYTRWGNKTCNSEAELVYSGFTGGSFWTHTGAAVDPLCLPRDPEWGLYKDGTNDGYKGYVFGAEYETYTYNADMANVHDRDVPCAVCLARNRSVVKMFPARKNCYNGWKLEYSGYLMAGYYGHKAGSMYTCIDGHPDTLRGSLP